MTKQNFSRFALFVVYFWFGILKVFGLSPATPLVLALLKITMPFIPAPTFMILFGLFECLIGVLFIIPKYRKGALVLFALHMIATTMPLILLPHMVWTSLLVPTLEGQFIIKNIIMIALALHL